MYYVPDSVSQADRKKLLPSKEELDTLEEIKAKLPMYNPILDEVQSLDALRKDLEYIYPAIKTMWDYLAVDRNYDEALVGNEADIVYAWCALAKAAQEPFFTEDGPMGCYFSQINSSVPAGSGNKTAGKSERHKSTNTPLAATDKIPAIIGTRVSKYTCDIDDFGTLTEYNGGEVRIILPDGIRAIGEDAFFGKDELISIVIPEGV